MDEGFCTIEVIFDGHDRAVDYRFLDVNRAFQDQTGLKDAVGKRIRDLVPGHEEHWFEIYGRIARTGEPARFENAAKALGRWYQVQAFRVGRPEQRQVAVFFNDITERKRAESALERAREELARANRDLERRVQERTASLTEAVEQMEEFSYTVSHDLRAPLRSMQIYAQALLEDYEQSLPPDAARQLARIDASARRLDKMILDVLTLSRLSRAQFAPSRVDVGRLVRQIIEQYPGMQPPRATFDVGPLPDVMGHEPSLTQALSNLLTNAVKFVAPGTKPRVRVWAQTRDGRVRLRIRDNGIGVDPRYQQRLFRMFERIHPDAGYEGTGVGLAIVRKAVERMGGRVGMESDGVNGSEFWIELPAAEGEAP